MYVQYICIEQPIILTAINVEAITYQQISRFVNPSSAKTANICVCIFFTKRPQFFYSLLRMSHARQKVFEYFKKL